MYNKPQLSLDQCRSAIKAMIAEHRKDPNNAPVAMAIVDDRGDLLGYARTDMCRPSSAGNAIKKAYTAAMRGIDSGVYAQQLKEQDRHTSDLGDPRIIPMQGGVTIINPGDGAILGGIGVGGLPSGQGDEDISRAGLKAMRLD